jgi:SAM-dependent methyltransferase
LAGERKMTTSFSHPIFARMYARMSPKMEQAGAAAHRQRLLDGLTGSVFEVGAGNGMNFAHYPATVTAVLAVEPEPYLRELAGVNAGKAPVRVEVVDGTADLLPAADGTFDAVVSSLLLCSVPDQAVALGEMYRVLRPGGELRFFEHVRAARRGLSWIQRLFDATFWPAVAGGCHTSRDTAAAIKGAGFKIERLERFSFPDFALPLPTSPHILGVARRP